MIPLECQPRAAAHRLLDGYQSLFQAKTDFTRFWDRIGAEGDLAALREWDTPHNASGER